jgi:hypothetical protein
LDIIAYERCDNFCRDDKRAYPGYLQVKSAADMVFRVRAALRPGARISLLRINSHGTGGGGKRGQGIAGEMDIGEDTLSRETWPQLRPYFQALEPLLADGAVVELDACELGRDVELLRLISLTLPRTTVRAGWNIQYPGGGLDGPVVSCRNGFCWYERRAFRTDRGPRHPSGTAGYRRR